MPNVVVDASTVVSAALKAESRPETALLFALTYDSLYLSEPVLDEIREVFSRPKFLRFVGEQRLAEMLADAHFVSLMANVHACRDPADDKYLDLAVAADVYAIVTGDHDLLSMSPWRGIRILNATEYAALIASHERLTR